MEYLKRDAFGAWQFDQYFTYITSLEGRLSASAYAFASDRDHYSLESPSSLHDAWLEQLTVTELPSGPRSEARHTDLALRFLGPRHDRIQVLRYSNVRSYRIGGSHTTDGHGDLLVHEVRLGKTGALVHELLFATGAEIIVECEDLAYTEEQLRSSAAGTA